MSVISSSQSKGSSGPRPSNSFLISSISRLLSRSVSRRPSSSRIKVIASVTFCEASAGSRLSRRVTSRVSKRRVWTASLSCWKPSAWMSLGFFWVVPMSERCIEVAALLFCCEMRSTSFIGDASGARADREEQSRDEGVGIFGGSLGADFEPSRELFDALGERRIGRDLPQILGAQLDALEDLFVARNFRVERLGERVAQLFLADGMARHEAAEDEIGLDV